MSGATAVLGTASAASWERVGEWSKDDYGDGLIGALLDDAQDLRYGYDISGDAYLKIDMSADDNTDDEFRVDAPASVTSYPSDYGSEMSISIYDDYDGGVAWIEVKK